MRSSSGLLLLLAVAMPACHHASQPATHTVNPGELVQLHEGESASIRGTNTQFRIEDINDSRCPADVQCVWAGQAAVVLTLFGTDVTRTDTLRLNKPKPDAHYGGYHIWLKEVKPFPRSARDSTAKVVTISVDLPS